MSADNTPAPELHPSLDWLNCERQTLAAQRGRVCVLLFWNASSVYSHNLVDAVSRLRGRYPNGLAVFAIHIPKFDTEQFGERVLKAANRLGMEWPVANDHGWVAWQHFEQTDWPAVVLIDALGQIRHRIRGDQPGAVLESALTELLDASECGREKQQFVRRGQEPRQPLRFPSGLAVTETHLYVADTGHHRILECSHAGNILRQFGSGQQELVDGGPDEAAFRYPRGLCLMRDYLYVADSGNHALRRIRKIGGEVDTLLGNGRIGMPTEGTPASPGAVMLNQPWDVAGAKDHLFLALAGNNQIWDYDLKQARLRCLAGTGALGIADGPGRSALLAQPSALALVEQNLYVIDSASSSIRAIQTSAGSVQTLVGQGVYEFGDQNGQRREARMQYPLALAMDPKSPVLWVADAYNRSLRRLRLGGGEMIHHDLPEPLQLPSALAVGAGALWIADADAHAVYRLDTASGELTRLPIGE